MSDPCRLKILMLLLEGELCVCEIMIALDRQRSTTSHHLSIHQSHIPAIAILSRPGPSPVVIAIVIVSALSTLNRKLEISITIK
jgi:DNA-binding transcriptional ArsR family regulator